MGDAQVPAIGAALVAAIRRVPRFAREDQVQRGRYVTPPQIPFACVSVPGMQSEQGPEMGAYERDLVYDIMAWDAPANTQINSASIAAEALADDLHTALESARLDRSSPLYKLGVFKVRTATLIGGEAHLPAGDVFALLVVETKFRRRVGLAGLDLGVTP